MTGDGSKHTAPLVCIEVREILKGAGYGSEPVVSTDVPLRSDSSRAQVEDEGNTGGMLG